jgi:Protein of unknown function DUF262/Protein of unknown function (DUF1524)
MAGNVTISEAPTTGLGRLITENRFFVPTHQRDYKWDRDRVERFIEDLTQAMERGDKFYFIGLMVFMGAPDGRLRVLDGQQRLATSIIIFSAMRTWFAVAGDDSMRIQYDFIGRADYGESKAEPKISMNRNNDDKFQRYITNQSTTEEIRAELAKTGKNDSNYSLLDAVVFCRQFVTDRAAAMEDAAKAKKYFADLIKFMRDSVIVVRLTVPNESNAFRVFETLNDRGMDLSAVDLLKNYLFGCVYDEAKSQGLTQMEHRWAQLTGTLQDLRQENFLKVYWTSRHGLVQLDDIFEKVKDECKTPDDAQNLSIDLLESSEHYAALDESDDPVWGPFGPECRRLIGNLRILGSKLVRPVILSGLKKLDAADFVRLLLVLEVIIVRWQVIGAGRTGTIERQCARLAELIWEGKVKNRTGMIEALSDLYIDDKTFLERFAEQDNLTNQKAAYLLRRIEDHERSIAKGGAGPELSPSLSLTIEHILPKNPSQEWADVIRTDPDIVKDCNNRLGNMCLLTEGRNREAARQAYSKKLPIYEKSELLTTQRVAKSPFWDRKSIEHHQAWLGSKAVAIWRLA